MVNRYSLIAGLLLITCTRRDGFRAEQPCRDAAGAAIPCDGTCNNQTQDAAETDVDCGGADCLPCGLDRMCLVDADCAVGACPAGVCALPACADALQNGNETDVDCGGACPACTGGQRCNLAADCQSGVCDGQICIGGGLQDAFNRPDSADLGQGWTDAFFFPGSGPTDYFSIAGNRAIVTGVAGSPSGGAVAPMTAFKNWDISVKVRRDAGDPALGIIARAVNDDYFYYFVLRGGQGDWQVRKMRDGDDAQIATGSYTWNLGSEVTLGLAVSDATLTAAIDGSPVWFGGGGAGAVHGNGGCGLFASAPAGSQGSFVDFSATSSLRGKTFHRMGFVTTETGSELVALSNGWPAPRVFVAEDGRALVLHIEPSGTPGAIRAGWLQSNATDYDSWSSNTIETFSVGGSVSAYGIAGWMDAADNVYAVWYGRSSSSRMAFVKLNKSAGTGWTQGVLTPVAAFGVDSAAVVKVPDSGRIWIFHARTSGGNYGSYHSTSEGAAWTVGPDFGPSLAQPSPPLFATAWASRVMLARKVGSSILATTRYDMDASASAWSADTTLWTSPAVNATDSWYHALLLRMPATADATVLAVAWLSNQEGRIARFIDGTGWQADVAYGSGLNPSVTRSAWDRRTGTLLLSGGTWLDYDPGSDSLVAVARDAVSSTVGDSIRRGRWYGGMSQGATGRSALYFSDELISTCGNGVQDGDESDVDCGGSCEACVNGFACQTLADCASRFCDNQVCATCTSDADCATNEGCDTVQDTCVPSLGCAAGGRRLFQSVALYPDIAACGPNQPSYAGAVAAAATVCASDWHMCTAVDLDSATGAVMSGEGAAWINYTDPSTTTFAYSTGLQCAGGTLSTSNLNGTAGCTNAGSSPEGWRLAVSRISWNVSSHNTTAGCVRHAFHACGYPGGTILAQPYAIACCRD